MEIIQNIETLKKVGGVQYGSVIEHTIDDEEFGIYDKRLYLMSKCMMKEGFVTIVALDNGDFEHIHSNTLVKVVSGKYVVD